MNKFLVFFFGIAVSIWIVSCEKDSSTGQIGDEHLINQITSETTVTPLEVEQMPVEIRSYVANRHHPMHIEWAYSAGPHGYELFLENGQCLYFDPQWRQLRNRERNRNHEFHGQGGFQGSGFCLGGDTIDVSQLPAAVMEYLETHYAGIAVVTSVIKPSGKFAVELANGEILIFGPDGTFLSECICQEAAYHRHRHHGMDEPNGWSCDPGQYSSGGQGPGGGMGPFEGMGSNCLGGNSISADELPPVVIEYINTNYPEATVIHATLTYNGNYFVRLSTCVRIVFDSQGDVIYDSGL